MSASQRIRYRKTTITYYRKKKSNNKKKPKSMAKAYVSKPMSFKTATNKNKKKGKGKKRCPTCGKFM